jgi:hypothetical protein
MHGAGGKKETPATFITFHLYGETKEEFALV